MSEVFRRNRDDSIIKYKKNNPGRSYVRFQGYLIWNIPHAGGLENPSRNFQMSTGGRGVDDQSPIITCYTNYFNSFLKKSTVRFHASSAAALSYRGVVSL